MDNVSPDKRSRIMASVKAKGNKSTELALLAFLRRERIVGWRRNHTLLGNPDLVFPKVKLAVFVDGCLWHGCSRHCRIPRANRDYWTKKIVSNKERDARINRRLRSNGWNVMRIWEHEIKTRSILWNLQKIKEIVQQARASDRAPRGG